MSQPLSCSAKACGETATTALLWNNPRLHDADRRKVWLACDTHAVTLGEFLGLRGFLRNRVPVDQIPAEAG